jgi:hypothetical protein
MNSALLPALFTSLSPTILGPLNAPESAQVRRVQDDASGPTDSTPGEIHALFVTNNE